MFILDASERVISPGTFRMRSVVARNTRHYTPPSQKLSGQTTAETNMTRREGGEAQTRRFMDRGRNIKPTRFVDAELDKPWSDEMKALAEKIMEKWETRPRTWQGQVMDCVIQGRDVLVRAGTGAGKSLCFQALALLRPGAIVLVVSPLVGLMENQVIQPFWYVSDSGRCWICLMSKSQQLPLQRTTLNSIPTFGNGLRPASFRWFMRLQRFYCNIAAISFSTL